MLRPKDRTSAQRRRNPRAEETKWRLARNRRLARRLAFDGLEDRTLLSGGNINFQTLGQDLAADLSAIQSSVNSAYQTATAIPIIGTDLQNNATISKLLSQFDTVATQLESLGTQANGSSVATLVQNQLLSALGPANSTHPGDLPVTNTSRSHPIKVPTVRSRSRCCSRSQRPQPSSLISVCPVSWA
jgi:hypothetical protein